MEVQAIPLQLQQPMLQGLVMQVGLQIKQQLILEFQMRLS